MPKLLDKDFEKQEKFTQVVNQPGFPETHMVAASS